MNPSFKEWWEGSANGILKGCLEHVEDRLVDLPEFNEVVKEGIEVDNAIIDNLNKNIKKIQNHFKNTPQCMYKYRVKFFVLRMKDFALEIGKYTGTYERIIAEAKCIAEGYQQIKDSLDLLFKRVEKDDYTLGVEDIDHCIEDISTIKMLDDYCTDILDDLLNTKEDCDEFVQYINNFMRRKFDEFINVEKEYMPLSVEDVLM